MTSQKLAIAQGEWALKRSQAQQEAAAASARAASRTASGGSSSGSSGSSASRSTAASAGSAAASAGSGIDYQEFARNMRNRGYTIDEIKAMFDAMRGA